MLISDLDQALFARGSYIVNAVSSCNDCHGNPNRDFSPGDLGTSKFLTIVTSDYLAGGATFGVPPPLQPALGQVQTMSANLIGASNGALYQPPPLLYPNFVALIESGVHLEDSPPRAVGFPMPTTVFRQMTSYDLQAIYTYLQNLKTPVGWDDKATQDPTRYCTEASDCAGGETCAATGECAGGACSTDADCDACQTCTSDQIPREIS